MANRRPQSGPRRPDYRNDRSKFNRGSVSPWQASNAGGPLPTLLPLGGSSTEATLALANNLISNLLQSRQNTVPSLLDMPMRRDFRPDMGFDRGFATPRMGNSFRRTGNYNRSGERINTHRKPFRSNDGPRNKQSASKDADKAKPVNKESSEETKAADEVPVKTEPMEETSEAPKEESKDTPKGTPKETPKSPYHGINADLLKCHICNKSMWDSRSFENHLNGRAHSIMMEKTAQSYDLTADTMRQEYKIREMKRARRSGQPVSRSRDFYCAMCDMFAPDGTAHRTAIGHRKLKKYLHPSCPLCHEELPTRIELDQHRLTATHLRNVQERNDHDSLDKPKAEVMVLSTLAMEQSYIREDRSQRRPRRNEKNADDAKEGEQEENEAVKTEEAGDKKPPEDENKMLDYKEGDDLTNFTYEMLPTYSRARGVGESFLEEFKCVQCRLCRKLLDSEETAAVHVKTWRHHQLYVKMLKEKSGVEAPEGGKRSAPEATPDDDSAPKRRKTDDEEKQDDSNAMDAEGVEGDQQDNGDFPEDDDNSWQGALDEVLDEEGLNGNDQHENEEEMVPEEEPQAEPEVAEPEPEPEPEPIVEPPPVVKKAPVVETPSPASKKTPTAQRGRGRGRRPTKRF